MCGITGVFAFKEEGREIFKFTENAVKSLNKRGPDSHGIYSKGNISLGHTRLSIIDTSNAGNQPFVDKSGNYILVFNGEFYNYLTHRKELEKSGIDFTSNSDTEVLLYLLIKEGINALNKINGCFSFAFYSIKNQELLLARDRMGINPLLYYYDTDKFIFGSEMKAILEFKTPKNIDFNSLYNYLQLNYIPGENSIFENIKRLKPGHYIKVNKTGVEINQYYNINRTKSEIINYGDAQNKLVTLLNEAVKTRLISDVPLGAFLSGGIDSSVIVALASRHTNHLNTFSIGFKDEPFFDETSYAELVANKFKTNHTVFSLSNDDLLHNLPSVLDYIDEPFADSSAIAVHILSMHTRRKATVALSGDGADEMFGGYNKHMAHYKAINSGISNKLVGLGAPLWKIMPKSRNSKFSNLFRQLDRFATGINLDANERYWRWSSPSSESYANKILLKTPNIEEYLTYKNDIVSFEDIYSEIDNILHSDMQMVLPYDMLTKVDLMSMANSLEVRTPFLDHNLVNFAFSLPDSFKINSKLKKRILQDSFRDILPTELYNRPKHGFEVPLLKWFRNELWDWIDHDLLSENFINSQDIFNYNEVIKLKIQLKSNNPDDSAAKIWALIVFQNWYKKNIV
jgi:asparagine synthase (glutamine-hydrolysing)